MGLSLSALPFLMLSCHRYSIELFTFLNCIFLSNIVIIPPSIRIIKGSAFYRCTIVSLPPIISLIGYNTFRWCSNLTLIELHSSLICIVVTDKYKQKEEYYDARINDKPGTLYNVLKKTSLSDDISKNA